MCRLCNTLCNCDGAAGNPDNTEDKAAEPIPELVVKPAGDGSADTLEAANTAPDTVTPADMDAATRAVNFSATSTAHEPDGTSAEIPTHSPAPSVNSNHSVHSNHSSSSSSSSSDTSRVSGNNKTRRPQTIPVTQPPATQPKNDQASTTATADAAADATASATPDPEPEQQQRPRHPPDVPCNPYSFIPQAALQTFPPLMPLHPTTPIPFMNMNQQQYTFVPAAQPQQQQPQGPYMWYNPPIMGPAPTAAPIPQYAAGTSPFWSNNSYYLSNPPQQQPMQVGQQQVYVMANQQVPMQQVPVQQQPVYMVEQGYAVPQPQPQQVPYTVNGATGPIVYYQ
ncbi:Uu.00g096220.m01.CDS01 [Anthostomella pinea]|uniref:Uu.00g096220.m01.CDS01 n=1 Tax=Anthostomella pinea TaxID=933095 RepID=A0AAI8VC89_9PEZI|nr:Uu.00g096220.m01.CDS01 [Anthostomella pinea]